MKFAVRDTDILVLFKQVRNRNDNGVFVKFEAVSLTIQSSLQHEQIHPPSKWRHHGTLHVKFKVKDKGIRVLFKQQWDHHELA